MLVWIMKQKYYNLYFLQAIDLVISSKLDSLLQLACDQSIEYQANLIPDTQKPYVREALKEYTERLSTYYVEAKKVGKDEKVPAPLMEYVVPKVRNDI